MNSLTAAWICTEEVLESVLLEPFYLDTVAHPILLYNHQQSTGISQAASITLETH